MGCGASKSKVRLSFFEKSEEGPKPKESNPDWESENEDDWEVDSTMGTVQQEMLDELLADANENTEKTDLYVDKDFDVAEDISTLYFATKIPSKGTVEWKRPSEILKKKRPELIQDGTERQDVCQGQLGDCWFLSALAAVARQPNLFKKVLPENQVLTTEDGTYKGMVYFKFWRFGSWVTVSIDDRLPTQNGRLVFSRCKSETEFWVPLVEKAYAKLHGSYEAIQGGQPMDALVDLTAGLPEVIKLDGNDDLSIWRQLLKAYQSGAILTCSKNGEMASFTEADAQGIVWGHAYSITKVAKVTTIEDEVVRLVRVRNPWADAVEWNGKWSDSDAAWEMVTDEEKERINYKDKDDGEFWICWQDFSATFSEMTICSLQPDLDGDGKADQASVQVVHGQWEKGKTAGGCRNDLESFAKNPQFLLTLGHPDDFDENLDEAESKGKCSVVIGLMQEYRALRKNKGVKKKHIGFIVYKTNKAKKLPPDHFAFNAEECSSGTYLNLREVMGRFELMPGKYVIIPSTFNPDQPGKFLIRAFAQKKFELKKL